MSLFDINASEKKDRETFYLKESTAYAEFFNAASLKQFKRYLGGMKQNMHYHFSTGGQWNMYELMFFVLSVTGPAHVWKSTWAISEDAVRAMIDMQKKGVILGMKCIFDYKTGEQKNKAVLLAQNNFERVVMTHCHAKVTVVRNEHWGVSISGSANDTRNPRIERGVICTDGAIAEQDIGWMEAVMAGEKVFSVRKNGHEQEAA